MPGGSEFSYAVVKRGEDDLGVILDSFTYEVLQIRPESVVDQQNRKLAAEPLVAWHQLLPGDRLLNVNGKQDRKGIHNELKCPSYGRRVHMKVVRTEDAKLASAPPGHPAAPSTIGVPAAPPMTAASQPPPPQEEAAAHAVAAAPTPAATVSAAAAEDTDTPLAAASPPAKAAGAEAAAQAFDEADPADAQPPPDAPDADAAPQPPGAGAQAGRTWHRYMHEVNATEVMYWWWCETDDFAFKETDTTWSLKPDAQVGHDVWTNGERSFIQATGVELP